MSRYTLPDPKCRHKRQTVRVSSHVDLSTAASSSEPIASTYCCAREDCQEDARAWVWASTHREPYVVPLRAQAASA